MQKLKIQPFPTIMTERLILRRVLPYDYESLYKLRSNEEVGKYLDREITNSIDQTKEFIKKLSGGISNNEWLYWVIEKRGTNTFLGTVCLWNFSEEKNCADIGYELLPEFQGQGFMSEAVDKVLEFGFNTIGLNLIYGEVHSKNENSIKLLLKKGFILSAESSRPNSDFVVYYLGNSLLV